MAEPQMVKVHVTVDVVINRAAYDAEYGTEETVQEIKDHIKHSVGEASANALNYLGEAGVIQSFQYR